MQQLVGNIEGTSVLVDDIGTQVLMAGLVERTVYVCRPPIQKTTGIVMADPDAPPDAYTVLDFSLTTSNGGATTASGGGSSSASSSATAYSLGLMTAPSPRALPPLAPTSGTLSGPIFAANEMSRLGWSPWVYHQQQYALRNTTDNTNTNNNTTAPPPRLCYAAKLAAPTAKAAAMSGLGSAAPLKGEEGGGSSDCATTSDTKTANPIAILAFQQQLYDYHHRRMVPIIDDDAWLVSDPGNITKVQWLLPDLQQVMAAPSFTAAGTVPERGGSATTTTNNSSTTAMTPDETEAITAVRSAIAANASLAWCLFVFFERGIALVQLETAVSCGFDDKEAPQPPSSSSHHDYEGAAAADDGNYNRHPYSDVGDNRGGFTAARIVWHVVGRYTSAAVCPIDWHVALACCEDEASATSSSSSSAEEDHHTVLVFANGASEKKISTSDLAIGGHRSASSVVTTSTVSTSSGPFLASTIDSALFRLSTTAMCVHYPKGRTVRSIAWRRVTSGALLAVSVRCPATTTTATPAVAGGRTEDTQVDVYRVAATSPSSLALNRIFHAAPATHDPHFRNPNHPHHPHDHHNHSHANAKGGATPPPPPFERSFMFPMPPNVVGAAGSNGPSSPTPKTSSSSSSAAAAAAASSSASMAATKALLDDAYGTREGFMWELQKVSLLALWEDRAKCEALYKRTHGAKAAAAVGPHYSAASEAEAEADPSSSSSSPSSSSSSFIVAVVPQTSTTHDTSGSKLKVVELSPTTGALYAHSYLIGDTAVNADRSTASSSSSSSGGASGGGGPMMSAARGGGVYNPVALRGFVDTFGPIAQLHVLPQSAGDRGVCEVLGGSVNKAQVRQQLMSGSTNPTVGGGGGGGAAAPSGGANATAGLVKSPRPITTATNNSSSSKRITDDYDMASDFEDLSQSFCCIFDKTQHRSSGGSNGNGSVGDRIDAQVLPPLSSLNHVVLERHEAMARQHLRMVVTSRSGACALISVVVNGEAKEGVIEHLYTLGRPSFLPHRTGGGGSSSLPSSSSSAAAARPPRVLDVSKGVELKDLATQPTAPVRESRRRGSVGASRTDANAPAGSTSNNAPKPYPFVCSSSRVIGTLPIAAVMYEGGVVTEGSTSSSSSSAASPSVLVHLYHVDGSGAHCIPLASHQVVKRRDLGPQGLVRAPVVPRPTAPSATAGKAKGSSATDATASSAAAAPAAKPAIDKDVVVAFMNVHGPAMVPRVDMLLTAMKGDAEKLLKNLRTKHGVADDDDSWMPAEMKAAFSAPAPVVSFVAADSASSSVAAPAAKPAIDKDVVVAFMNVHSPAMAPRVDMLLTAMKGDAEKLLKNLRTKHGVADDDDSWMPAEMKAAFAAPPPAPTPAATATGSVVDASAYSSTPAAVAAVKLATASVPIGAPTYVSLVLTSIPTAADDARLRSSNADAASALAAAATSGYAPNNTFTSTSTRTNVSTVIPPTMGAATAAASAFVPNPRVLLLLVFDERRHLWGAAEVLCDLSPLTSSFSKDLLTLAPITPAMLASTALAPVHGSSANNTMNGNASPISNASLASLVAGAINGHGASSGGGGVGVNRGAAPIAPSASATSSSGLSAATTFARQFTKWGRSMAAFPAIPALYSLSNLLLTTDGGAAAAAADTSAITYDAERLLRSLSQSGEGASDGWTYDSTLSLQRHSTANVPTVVRWMPTSAEDGENGGAGDGGFVLAAAYRAHTNAASLFARPIPSSTSSSTSSSSLDVPKTRWELFVRTNTGSGSGTAVDMTFMCPRVVVESIIGAADNSTSSSSSSSGVPPIVPLPRADVILYKGPTVVSIVVLFGSVLMIFQLDPGRALSAPLAAAAVAAIDGEDGGDGATSQRSPSSSSASFELVFAQCGVANMFALPAAAKGSIARGKPIGGSNLAKPSLLTVTAVAPSEAVLYASCPAGALARKAAPLIADGSAPLIVADQLAAPITFAIDLAAPLAAVAGLYASSSPTSAQTHSSSGGMAMVRRRKVGSFVLANAFAAEALLQCFDDGAAVGNSSASNSVPMAAGPTHVVDLSGAPSTASVASPTNSSYFGGTMGGSSRGMSSTMTVGSGGGPQHLLSLTPPSLSALSENETAVYRVEIVSNPHRLSKAFLSTKIVRLGGESSRALSAKDLAAYKATLGATHEVLVTAMCLLRPPPKAKSRTANSSLRSMVLVGGASIGGSPSSSASSAAPPLLYVAPLELLLTSPFSSLSASAQPDVTPVSVVSTSTAIASALAGPFPEAVELLRDTMSMFTEGRWPSLVRALAHLIQSSRKHTNRIVANTLLAKSTTSSTNNGGGGGPLAEDGSRAGTADDASVLLAELLAPPISNTPRPSEDVIRSLVGQFLSLGQAPMTGLVSGGGGSDNDPASLDLRSRVPVVDASVIESLHNSTSKSNTRDTNRGLISSALLAPNGSNGSSGDVTVGMSGYVDVYAELLECLTSVGATGLSEIVAKSSSVNGGPSNNSTTDGLSGVSAEIVKFLSEHLGLCLHNGAGTAQLLASSAVTEEAVLTLSPLTSPVDGSASPIGGDTTNNDRHRAAGGASSKTVAVLQPAGSHLSSQAATFLEALCAAAVETLTNCSIVGLTSAQQLEVYVSIETIRTMLGQFGRMDTASKRLLTLWRQREVNKKFAASSASFAPVVITPSSMCWAMLSDAQDQLVDTINPTQWEDCVTSGIPLWTKSLLTLRRIAESIGKNLYGKSRDIKECALMFVLAKKVSSLISFAKNTNDMRLHDFFSRDFSERINQKAAVANGYAAVSKGALTYGSAFFVLGGDAISAAMAVVQRTGDWMMGLLIVRLGYDDDPLRIEEYLQYLEQSPDVSLTMWERCALRWRQGQYVDALKELWVAEEQSSAAAAGGGGDAASQPSSPVTTSSSSPSGGSKGGQQQQGGADTNEAAEVLQFLQHCCGGVTVLARYKKDDLLPLEVRGRLHLASARHNARRGLVAAAAREYLLLWVALDAMRQGIVKGTLLAAYTKEAEDALAKAKAAEEAAKLPPPKIQADFNTGTIAMFGMDSDDDDEPMPSAAPPSAAPPKPEPAPKLPKGSDSDDSSDDDSDSDDDDDSDEYEEDEEDSEDDDAGPSPPNVRPRPPPTYNVPGKAQWLADVGAAIPMLLVEARTYLSSYLGMVAPSEAALPSASASPSPLAKNTSASSQHQHQQHGGQPLMASSTVAFSSSSTSNSNNAGGVGPHHRSLQQQQYTYNAHVNGPVAYDEYGAPIRSRQAMDTSSHVRELLGGLLALGSSFESPPSGNSKEALALFIRDLLGAFGSCSDGGARCLVNPILLWVLSAYAVASRSEALGAALCIVTVPIESEEALPSSANSGSSSSSSSNTTIAYLKQLAMAATVLRNETYQHFVHLSDLLESGAINGSALRLAEARAAWGGRMRHWDDSEDVFRLMRLSASQTIRAFIALRAIPTNNILVTRLLLQATLEYYTLTKIMVGKRSYIPHRQLIADANGASATTASSSSSVKGAAAVTLGPIIRDCEATEALSSAHATASSACTAALTASSHWSVHAGLAPMMDEIPAFATLRWSLVTLSKIVSSAVDREVELQRQAHQDLIISSSSSAAPNNNNSGSSSTTVVSSLIPPSEPPIRLFLSRKITEALAFVGRTFCAFALIGAIRQPATVLWPLQSPLSAFAGSSMLGQLLLEVSSNRALALSLECMGNYRQALTSQDLLLGLNGAVSDHDGSLMEAMAAPAVSAASASAPPRRASAGPSSSSSSPFGKPSTAAATSAFASPTDAMAAPSSPLYGASSSTYFTGANAIEDVAWLYSLAHHTMPALREAEVLMAIRCSTASPQTELLPLLSNDPRSVGLEARKQILTAVTEELTRAAASSAAGSSSLSTTTMSSGVRLMGGGAADSAGFFLSGSRLVGASPFSPVSSGGKMSFPNTATSVASSAQLSNANANAANTTSDVSLSHTFRFRSSGLARERTQLHADSHGVTGIAVDRSSYDNVAVASHSGLVCLHGMRDGLLADADAILLKSERSQRESATEQFATSFRPDREGYGGWSHTHGVVSLFGSTGHSAATIVGATSRPVTFNSTLSGGGSGGGDQCASTLSGTSKLVSHPYLPVYVATSSAGRCSIFQYGNDDRLAHFHDNSCGQLSALAFSPHGDNFVMVGAKGSIALWRFGALPAPFRLTPMHFSEASDAKFIDGKNSVVAVAGTDYTGGDGSSSGPRFPFGSSSNGGASSSSGAGGRGKLSLIDFALPHHHGLAATIELPFAKPLVVLHDSCHAPTMVGAMDGRGRIAIFDLRAGRLLPMESTPRIDLGGATAGDGGSAAGSGGPPSFPSILSPSSKEKDANATGTATAATLSEAHQLLAVGTQCGDLALFSTRGFWGSAASTSSSSFTYSGAAGHIPLQPVMATSTAVSGRRPTAGNLSTLAVTDVLFTPSSLVYATGEGRAFSSPLIGSVVQQLY